MYRIPTLDEIHNIRTVSNYYIDNKNKAQFYIDDILENRYYTNNTDN